MLDVQASDAGITVREGKSIVMNASAPVRPATIVTAKYNCQCSVRSWETQSKPDGGGQ
jgi:hypothetical protein